MSAHLHDTSRFYWASRNMEELFAWCQEFLERLVGQRNARALQADTAEEVAYA